MSNRKFLYKVLKSFVGVVVLCLLQKQGYAADIVIVDKHWKITYVEKDKWFRLNLLNSDGTARKALFNRSMSEVKYDNASGEERTVNTASFAQVNKTEAEINDEFGTGKCYTFTFVQPDNGDEVTMEQHFYIYDDHRYLITDLSIIGDASVRSNYLVPVCVTKQGFAMLSKSSNNRMLYVPFENDGWQRYSTYKLDCEMTSYEATALFSGDTQEGMVIGSVDHNRWKNAVNVNASDNHMLNTLKVYSGAASSATRDEHEVDGKKFVFPHGKVKGPKISSARFLINYVDDWRDGMEEYARANTLVVPKRDTWTDGTPFGWQSWGVMSTKNNFVADCEIAEYYDEVLKPGGFVNSQGKQIIGIDSWDNLSDSQKEELCQIGAENDQVVGMYHCPFAWWWGDWEKMGTSNYTAKDCFLKVNGQPKNINGAWCLDPTHPGTKSYIASTLRKFKRQGVKFVKLDFTTWGMVQADSYYASSVTTAMEAYNNGMNYLQRIADEDDNKLFISLSISPLFPYQYANSRRVGCDTWSDIGQTEFNMSVISCGWWTDQLYQYNDPDHLVMVGTEGWGSPKDPSLGENRARFTSGAVTGMMLVADNFSLKDESGQGNPTESRLRAPQIMMNKDINEMADLGRSFRPVYGHKEHNGNSNGAENFFMHHTKDYLYVAIFNYLGSEIKGSIPIADLSIAKGEFTEVKELWSGEIVTVNNELVYNVPGKDVKVFRFQKKGSDIVDTVIDDACERKLDVQVLSAGHGAIELSVTSPVPFIKLEAFDVTGRLLKSVDGAAQCTVCMTVTTVKEILLLRATAQDGCNLFTKVVVG